MFDFSKFKCKCSEVRYMFSNDDWDGTDETDPELLAIWSDGENIYDFYNESDDRRFVTERFQQGSILDFIEIMRISETILQGYIDFFRSLPLTNQSFRVLEPENIRPKREKEWGIWPSFFHYEPIYINTYNQTIEFDFIGTAG